MYAALVVFGYEYHDDYIELGEASICLDSFTDEVYNFGTAERAIHDFVFEVVTDEEDGWVRLESIERVR